MPSSRGSSRPRDQTQVSCIAGRFFTIWATWEAQILPGKQKRGSPSLASYTTRLVYTEFTYLHFPTYVTPLIKFFCIYTSGKFFNILRKQQHYLKYQNVLPYKEVGKGTQRKKLKNTWSLAIIIEIHKRDKKLKNIVLFLRWTNHKIGHVL